MDVTPAERPIAATGTWLSTVELFPSCPAPLYPQHHTHAAEVNAQHWAAPEFVMAQVCAWPAETAVEVTHFPSQQKSPMTQSAWVVQLVMHEVLPQIYGAHCVVVPTQVPIPLHDPDVNALLLSQYAHVVPGGYMR